MFKENAGEIEKILDCKVEWHEANKASCIKTQKQCNINDELNSRTMTENFDAGFKIMGIGMIAVFGVLTILYIVIKVMGQFAKGKDDKNEKN